MATKDPAFLFYPAEASDDTQFMNRLERGAYFDLLKAQKKFLRFTIETIKKVLGKDFDECWQSIESILKKDETGYFIEWADESIEKRKEFSKIQSNRIKDYHRRKSLGNVTAVEPTINQISTNVQPLELEMELIISNKGIGNEGLSNMNSGENSNFSGISGNYEIDILRITALADTFFLGQYHLAGVDAKKIAVWLTNFNNFLRFNGEPTIMPTPEYRRYFANWFKKVNSVFPDPHDYSPAKDLTPAPKQPAIASNDEFKAIRDKKRGITT